MRVRPVLLAALVAAGAPAARAVGDAAHGALQYEARCGGCHSPDEHRVGPAHRGVFGRRAGSASGFDYSPALRSSTIVWDEATLDAWLTDPDKLIPGQGMNIATADAGARRDIVAFLRSLSSR
jgi:cytochrome c